MIEFLRHFFGFCGEHWHPSVLTTLLGLVGLKPTIQYVRSRYLSRKK